LRLLPHRPALGMHRAGVPALIDVLRAGKGHVGCGQAADAGP
jgi:hypothetical protein